MSLLFEVFQSNLHSHEKKEVPLHDYVGASKKFS